MPRGTVWISEDDEPADDGWVLTGRFSGYLHTGGEHKADRFADLDLDAALAWARARANEIYVTIDDERYDASAAPAGEDPPLPPDLPHPVRRRPAGEEWKDRTDADEPIDWVVAAWLRRADNIVPDRGRDPEIAAIAERTGAAGWSADELDAGLADIEAARGQGEAGWFSYHRIAYRLDYEVRAPTRARAIEAAAQRCGKPAGWKVELEAQPSG